MSQRRCFSFEPSGHNFHPLDGMVVNDGTMVYRLFCKSCGRISVANTENNLTDWNFDTLPNESKADYLTNLPLRGKSDA